MRLLEIPWRHLLHKELRSLLAGRAFWVLLLVQSLLTGASSVSYTHLTLPTSDLV